MGWHFCLAVSDAIGMGHLTRCLALQERLPGLVDRLWIWTDWPATRVRELAGGAAFEVVPLACEGWPAAAPADQVLIDMPDPPRALLQATAQARRKVLLGCSDARMTWADLVVNVAEGGPLVSPPPRQVGHTVVCEGAAYALLRPAFLAGRQRPYRADGPVLVAVGGTDAARLTLGLAEQVLATAALADREVWAVCSPRHPDRQRLEHVAGRDRRLRVLAPSAAIAAWLQQAGGVLLAPGNLLFESLALEAPAVAVAQNERQRADFAQYPWLVPGRSAAAATEALVELLASGLADFARYAQAARPGQAIPSLIDWFRRNS